jgi:hypothetical protein
VMMITLGMGSEVSLIFEFKEHGAKTAKYL